MARPNKPLFQGIKNFVRNELDASGPIRPLKPRIGDIDFDELTQQRVQVYDTITLDLSTARDKQKLDFIGTYIYALEGTAISSEVEVRFNEASRKPIKITEGRGLRIPFYRLFFSNSAQSGESITLIVGIESAIFEVFDWGGL